MNNFKHTDSLLDILDEMQEVNFGDEFIQKLADYVDGKPVSGITKNRVQFFTTFIKWKLRLKFETHPSRWSWEDYNDTVWLVDKVLKNTLYVRGSKGNPEPIEDIVKIYLSEEPIRYVIEKYQEYLYTNPPEY